MLRTLSSVAAAGMLAVVGSVSLAATTANAGTEAQTAPASNGAELGARCNPGERHGLLVVHNLDGKKLEYSVRDCDRGDVQVGDLKKGQRDEEDVDAHTVRNPDDDHVKLAIGTDSDEDEKVKLKKKDDESSVTGTAKAGEQTLVTVKNPTENPTKKTALPVTGPSSATYMAIGLGMLGVGAAALLFVVYRARRLED